MSEADPVAALRRRHVRWGWWTLLLFLSLGIALEAMHGFKVSWFLAADNETRRLLLRLAHTHGTLLGLVHLGFAFTLTTAELDARLAGYASAALRGATLLLPGGFLLGGWVIHAGDPGRAIVLVPIGALLLFVAVLLVAARARPR